MNHDAWPALAYGAWMPTKKKLYTCAQMIGKASCLVKMISGTKWSVPPCWFNTSQLLLSDKRVQQTILL